MRKEWAILIIGVGVGIIVTIFGVVVKTMPILLVILGGFVGLVLIIVGIVRLCQTENIPDEGNPKLDVDFRGGRLTGK